MTHTSRAVNKVTISLPSHLLQYASRKAAAQGTSRSQWIAEVIAQTAAVERNKLAAEGYRFYAQEAEDFAAASLSAASEAMQSCS